MHLIEKAIFFLALFFLVFAFPSKALASENLVQNGEFGDVSVWGIFDSGSYEVTDERGKVTGTSTTYSSGIKQRVTISPNKSYRFYGKIKFDDARTSGAKIRVGWYESDTSPQLPETPETSAITTVSDSWKEVENTAVSPNNAKIAEIRLLVAIMNKNNPGVAYFDDIIFEETTLPSPSPNPSPSPSPQNKGTCKVNDVKDNSSNILSSVKIYIDDVYIGHYAPETVTFCNGCKCDDVVACGFGEHTIKLEKTGFKNWAEKKTINSGDSIELNAIMSPADPSPSPSPTSSPSPTPKTTTKKTTDNTAFQKEVGKSEDMLLKNKKEEIGEVLSATQGAEKSPPTKTPENKEKPFIMPFVISGGGLLLLLGASFPFVKPKIVEFIRKRRGQKSSPATP